MNNSRLLLAALSLCAILVYSPFTWAFYPYPSSSDFAWTSEMTPVLDASKVVWVGCPGPALATVLTTKGSMLGANWKPAIDGWKFNCFTFVNEHGQSCTTFTTFSNPKAPVNPTPAPPVSCVHHEQDISVTVNKDGVVSCKTDCFSKPK